MVAVLADVDALDADDEAALADDDAADAWVVAVEADVEALEAEDAAADAEVDAALADVEAAEAEAEAADAEEDAAEAEAAAATALAFAPEISSAVGPSSQPSPSALVLMVRPASPTIAAGSSPLNDEGLTDSGNFTERSIASCCIKSCMTRRSNSSSWIDAWNVP